MAFSLDYTEQSLKKFGTVIADNAPVGHVFYVDLGKVDPQPETVEELYLESMRQSMRIVDKFVETARVVNISDAEMEKFQRMLKAIEDFDEFFEELGL